MPKIDALLAALVARYHRRFPPRKKVLDHHSPVLRWDRGQSVTAFQDLLACGHRLEHDGRVRDRRPCPKCAEGAPPDFRVKVRGHRYVASGVAS
jgi:hypothetical protein